MLYILFAILMLWYRYRAYKQVNAHMLGKLAQTVLLMVQDLKSLKPVPLVSQVWTEPCPVSPTPAGPRPSDLLLTAAFFNLFIIYLCLGSRSNSRKVLPFPGIQPFPSIIKALVSSQTERPWVFSVLSVPTMDLPALPWGLASDGSSAVAGWTGKGRVLGNTDLPSLFCALTSFPLTPPTILLVPSLPQPCCKEKYYNYIPKENVPFSILEAPSFLDFMDVNIFIGMYHRSDTNLSSANANRIQVE